MFLRSSRKLGYDFRSEAETAQVKPQGYAQVLEGYTKWANQISKW